MPTMPFPDDWDDWYFAGDSASQEELEDLLDQLECCVKNNEVIPLDLYVRLDQYGLIIDDLINFFEKETFDGEDELYDSYWGC